MKSPEARIAPLASIVGTWLFVVTVFWLCTISSGTESHERFTMAVTEKSAKITVDLGDRQLYRRLRMAAVEQDLTTREIVIEAVSFWLDHQELVEDTLAEEKAERVIAESSGDYIRDDKVKARSRARD